MTRHDHDPTTSDAVSDDVVLRSAGRLRWVIMAALPVAVVAAVVLNLSDRVPRLLELSAVRLGVAPRVRGGVVGIDPFTLLHFVGWGGLAFAAVLVVGRMRWVPLVAASLIVASSAIEVLQETSTLLRGYELSDIVANTAGVVAGSFAAMSVLAALDRRRRSVRVASRGVGRLG